MAARYTPKYRFVLTDKSTRKFPKIDTGLINERKLTDTLEETYIFDDRDEEEMKKRYYNIIYKGIAEFEPFRF